MAGANAHAGGLKSFLESVLRHGPTRRLTGGWVRGRHGRHGASGRCRHQDDTYYRHRRHGARGHHGYRGRRTVTVRRLVPGRYEVVWVPPVYELRLVCLRHGHVQGRAQRIQAGVMVR